MNDLIELIEALRERRTTLQTMSAEMAEAHRGVEAVRLAGKAEGVGLALSFVLDYQRERDRLQALQSAYGSGCDD